VPEDSYVSLMGQSILCLCYSGEFFMLTAQHVIKIIRTLIYLKKFWLNHWSFYKISFRRSSYLVTLLLVTSCGIPPHSTI